MPGRLTKLVGLVDKPHLPRRTVRLRLTLLYGALFVVSGAALLAITNVLVRNSTDPVLFLGVGREAEAPPAVERPPLDEPDRLPPGVTLGDAQALPEELRAQSERLQAQGRQQREHDLDQLLIQSGIALGLMSMVSIGLGWVMSGRVLRPVRTMTATTRRISEHNLHERLALEGPRDELTELGDTIDGLLARLEAAFDAQQRFVANASHELRTPLSMMRTSLDVAAAKPRPMRPEMEALDGKLREGLDRADRLLESFLTLARAQRGAVPDQAAVALRQVVSGVLADRGDAIEANGIDVDRELEDVHAIGSETLLAHLVDNVIDNAIRHNEPRGWIRVATEASREAARLVIESGGRRLDPTEVRELAQPFRRLGTERTDPQNGVGLGLSIVAAIAEAHGGELELEARAEGGLRVRIELPRAPAGSATSGATG
jgi:signal transduction histidine kinase